MRILRCKFRSQVACRASRSRGLLLVLVIGALSTGSPVFAADPIPLMVEVESASFLSRTTGPYPLHLTLRWGGVRLLEGRLRIDVRDGDDLKCTLLSDELVLNRGDTRSTWLIPMTGSPNGMGQLTLDMKWIGDGSVKWSVTHPLRIPGETRRTVVMGVCAESSELQDKIERALAIEQVLPIAIEDENRPIVTLAPPIPAAEMPSEPLQLCTLDVLLVSENSLRALIPAQKQAVSTWVRAGGAVAIIAHDSRWRSDELAFVRGLLESRDDLVVLAKDSGGLEVTGADERAVVTAHHGLGVVVLVVDAEAALKDKALMRETGFELWRIRDGARVAPTAPRPVGLLEGLFGSPQPSGPPTFLGSLNHPSKPEMRGLVDELLPRGVRVVPLVLIAAVLAAYVFLVGPVDYVFLGLIRRRKWTWITFPLLTAAIAWGALVITREYLRVRGPARSVVFRDVLGDGSVVRETRLSVLFEMTGGELVTPIPRGLFYAYGPELLQQDPRQAAMMGLGSPESTIKAPPVLEGRMPHAMKARQELPERVPFLHRQLTIPLETEERIPVPNFNWEELPDIEAGGRVDLTIAIAGAFGEGVTSYVFRKTDRITITGSSNLFRSQNRADIFMRGTPIQIAVPPGGMGRPPGYGVEVERDLIDQTTARDNDLFLFVSRVSPACDPALEDLAFFDPSDENQRALVIAVPDENGWVVYRRLYRRQADGRWR